MNDTKRDERFLVTPKNQLASFVREVDRTYFAKPVRVMVLMTDEQGLVWVEDPVRKNTFPVVREKLRRSWQLTNRQKEAMQPERPFDILANGRRIVMIWAPTAKDAMRKTMEMGPKHSRHCLKAVARIHDEA